LYARTAYKGIEGDALGLELADDIVQAQSFIKIVHHQDRPDRKEFILGSDAKLLIPSDMMVSQSFHFYYPQEGLLGFSVKASIL
jgi:hypothetical protein